MGWCVRTTVNGLLELWEGVEHSPNSSCCIICEKSGEGAKERKNSLARVSVTLPLLPLLEVDNLTSPSRAAHAPTFTLDLRAQTVDSASHIKTYF